MNRFIDIAVATVLAGAVPTSAVSSFFDVSIDGTSAGPPYPTSATRTTLFHGDLPSPSQLGTLEMGIQDVTGTLLASRIRASDPAGGPGVLSTSSSFDVFLEPSQPIPPTGTSSLFDVWMQPFSNSGQPGVFQGASGGGVLSSFRIDCNVVADGELWPQLTLRGRTTSGQPIHFWSGTHFDLTDNRIHIMPEVVFDGPVNTALPLFTITMTPEPSSMLLLLAGAGLFRRTRRRA